MLTQSPSLLAAVMSVATITDNGRKLVWGPSGKAGGGMWVFLAGVPYQRLLLIFAPLSWNAPAQA